LHAVDIQNVIGFGVFGGILIATLLAAAFVIVHDGALNRLPIT
jgi:hypothetical protein